MRRSRRKGQLRRTCPIAARSHSTTSISSSLADARASTRPKGSATKDWPQKRTAVLAPDAVHHRHEDAVRDRVRALDRLPGVVLRGVHLGRLVELPADRRRIEEDLGARQRDQPRRLGEPLVPAHQRPDLRLARGDAGKAEVARA